MPICSFLIPNIEDYFNDLLRVFNQCQDVNNGGVAEYFCRRISLQDFQRTLLNIYSRMTNSQSYSVQLVHDIECLLEVIDEKIETLEQLYNDSYYQDGIQFPLVNFDDRFSSLSYEVHRGNVSRPCYAITEEQITVLHNTLGFRWADAARMLGVSYRMLIRRRQEFALPVRTQHNFSVLSDEQLDKLVGEIRQDRCHDQ